MNKRALFLLPTALLLLFAIKPRYGGTVSIRLNEPTAFALNTSNYSNLIFYSLIYENFFYADSGGDIETHLFQSYLYDGKTRTLILELKDNLSFSNGEPITAKSITGSLKAFLEMDIYSSAKVNKILKGIRSQDNLVFVELQQDVPDIVRLLAVPELVASANSADAFSGPFYPAEWEKNRFLLLKANPFYPGGRPYLDGVKVIFESTGRFDLFLSSPSQSFKDYTELPAGIFQNVYLIFPQGDVGQNTKVALYTLLQSFNDSIGNRFAPLHALTSDDESPIAIRISPLSNIRVSSILKSSGIALYFLSSLSQIETEWNQFLAGFKFKIQSIFIDDAQLKNLINTMPVKFVIVDKIFQKKSPPEEKLMQILKESAYLRLSEKYLKMASEVEEIKMLNNQELMFEQLARINEAIIGDGVIIPLFQKKYSLYVQSKIEGLAMDYFARPLLQKARATHD